jgi:broad specificity phosphatase PhoE
MLVLLVRHGHAGTKRHWRGADSLRPLNGEGWAEAEALGVLLAAYAPSRIVSSPFLRCLESVTPLGHAIGIDVESSSSLVPDAGSAAASFLLGLGGGEPGTVVVCTHGEVIHDLQSSLGNTDLPSFGPEAPREKASVWLLDLQDGRFVSATYLPPPSAEH